VPKKVALLIGVSQYGEGLPPLLAAPNDVAALQRVLENSEMGGFDQVEPLIDPGLVDMQQAIRKLCSHCQKDDLLLLYFSGHGLTDDSNHLYFATRLTNKHDFEATAVPASFIQQQSMQCYAKRQIIILDCCYSGAFKQGWQAKAPLDLKRELGAEGRVVLTSSTATQTSFQQEEANLSLYTQYLVEGIETGAADRDLDGQIFVRELHDYAKAKVQEAKPTMKPDILLDKEGFNILLSKAPRGDRTLDFRQLVEQSARQGEISTYRRDTLRLKQQEWGLTEEAAETIINSVLEPFRRRLANLERFKTVLQEELNKQFPLDVALENDLRDWQRQVLGLADEDVAAIWQQMITEKPGEDASRQQQEAERQTQPAAEQQQRQQLQSPSTTRHWTRRQVLKWASFGGMGLLVTAIAASLRGLFGNSTVEPIVAPPKDTPPTATAAKLAGLPLQTMDFETVTVDERGTVNNRTTKQVNFIKEELGNGISLDLVSLPGGPFTMGSPAKETDRGSDEAPQRQVKVAAFAMGRYAVTQAQYQAIMGRNPSHFKGANRPVEQVSWHEAVEFCTRLSSRTGRTYDLPSEAEWEYACRAGTTTPFYFGETITSDLANYDGNSTYGSGPKGVYRQETTEVGRFPPNAFGLYDMHGNVWEWCLDHYRSTYQGAPMDGSAYLTQDKAAARLLRGGSWFFNPMNCRSANRNRLNPASRNYLIGFRVMLRSG
jgi:formylglycine-generating enzyme required for sulfatase activity